MISAVTENATKSGNRMAFLTLELVDGTVAVTVFPEPYRSCGAPAARGPVLVRGRTDESDKGRVVLAEEIKPLDDATAGALARREGAPALTCLVRMRARTTRSMRGSRRCASVRQEHRGRTPLFVHVLLPDQEVVVRVKELPVDPGAPWWQKSSRSSGRAVFVDYAGRA